MSVHNFKFHLVTVVGIFLALALGILIGSTFTEEGIIQQQRGTIERMREDIELLQDQRRELRGLSSAQGETITLLEEWLGDLQGVYWQANPVTAKAVLIHDSSFDPEFLGPFLNAGVVQTQIRLDWDQFAWVEDLAEAIIRNDLSDLYSLEGVALSGELTAPVNYIFLAVDPGKMDLVQIVATSCLDAQLSVIALGSAGEGLANLVSHNLYNSVSHLDSPLGLYCLGAILQGQGGHYGLDNLLPPRGVGR